MTVHACVYTHIYIYIYIYTHNAVRIGLVTAAALKPSVRGPIVVIVISRIVIIAISIIRSLIIVVISVYSFVCAQMFDPGSRCRWILEDVVSNTTVCVYTYIYIYIYTHTYIPCIVYSICTHIIFTMYATYVI